MEWASTPTFLFVMAATTKIQDLEVLLKPVVEGLGYELVDLQLRTERGRLVLRLLVDRPGGITLDECAGLSREVSPHLDVADPIRGRYVLEVSSPGIRRPLKRARDFERFQGEKLVVRTHEPVQGRKTFRGRNLGVDGQQNLRVEDAETQEHHVIPLAAIREACLDPEIRF